MTYRLFSLVIAALCLGQAAMIGALFVQRARRRRAKADAFPGNLAHELSQPLTAILANAQAARRLLALDPPDLAEVRQCLDEIVESDRLAAAIVHRLRSTEPSRPLVN